MNAVCVMGRITLDKNYCVSWLIRHTLYNVVTEFAIPMILVRLIEMCLNETCSNSWIGRHLSDTFHIQNFLSPSPSPCFRI